MLSKNKILKFIEKIFIKRKLNIMKCVTLKTLNMFVENKKNKI